MANKDLINLTEEMVAFAQKNGASETQLTISETKEFSVEVREGNIEKLSEAGIKSMSIKVIVDKKSATASSTDLKKETIQELIKNAIKRAKISSIDEFAGIPPLQKFKIDDLGINNLDIVNLKPEDKIAFAKNLEKLGLADKRILKSGGSGFSTNIGTRYLANSNGFSGSYDMTSCSAGVSLQGGDNEKMIEDGWWENSVSFIDMPRAELIASKAIERVTSLIGGKKIKSENLPVIFESNIASSILGFLAGCLNGSSIYMKSSFLAGKLGEMIAPDFVNIVDNGRIPRAIGSRPFDSEGNPTQITNLIEKGKLNSYILDHYSGKKLGLTSTGNAGGAHNLYLSPGKYSLDEMIASIEKGILITKTIGQGTVPTTGDISKGAYGIMIEKGKLTFPVDEITFSGNLGEILKNIEMIGNDLKFRGSVNSPSIKIKNITIGGE
jgi:PmbA protein